MNTYIREKPVYVIEMEAEQAQDLAALLGQITGESRADNRTFNDLYLVLCGLLEANDLPASIQSRDFTIVKGEHPKRICLKDRDSK